MEVLGYDGLQVPQQLGLNVWASSSRGVVVTLLSLDSFAFAPREEDYVTPGQAFYRHRCCLVSSC